MQLRKCRVLCKDKKEEDTMVNNFDEAKEASAEIFTNGQTEFDGGEATVNDEGGMAESHGAQAEEQTVQAAGTSLQASLNDAASTAEAAAQAASEINSQLRQALEENESLKQQNQQLQGTIEELSQRNEKHVLEEALTPPTLDINALAFADDETRREAMAKYAEEMSSYNRSQLMKEMSPAIEYAKRGMIQAEKAETINALKQIPQLAGIEKMLPQLDGIIEKNKWLSSSDMPMDEKYINAFALASGINSINNPPQERKKPTTSELMELYNSDPAFQEMVERQRLEAIRQGQQVPTFSANSGASGAALNIQDKPRNFEEALANAKKQHIF